MLDWDKLVLGPLERVFGEPITYTPSSGAPLYINGVFDEAHKEVDPNTGTAFSTVSPLLGVRDALFPVPPAQGDTFVVHRLNKRYVVRDPQPDGLGHHKLLCNLVGDA